MHMAQSQIDTGPRKFVVFLDSLGTDDVENHTDFIKNNVYDGHLERTDPYVTPTVMGSIYTGEDPSGHGLPAVSRHGQEDRGRPAAITLPEIAAESDEYGNVANLGLPFIVPPQADPGDDTYWHASEAMGQQMYAPSEAQGFMHVNGPAGDLSDPEEDGDILFQHRVDNVRETFSTARTLADSQDFDVMFISCRILDNYCHYRFREGEDERGITDRQVLLQHIIDEEIEMLTSLGEVFVFGDHGAADLDNVFKINRWLMDNDYLDIEINEEKIEWAIEEGLMNDPDEHGKVRTVEMPGVTVNEENSVAIGNDPFSGGLTLLDGATDETVVEMVEELVNTEYVDSYYFPAEVWDGPYVEECPDIFLGRAVGTFISGNCAEEMGGPEVTRSGVHHPYGAWGSTTDIDAPGEVSPMELFDIILGQFLGLEKDEDHEREFGAPTGVDADEEPTDADGRDVKENLRDLGYM